MLIFRQLFDAESSTYTYLLGDVESGEAVIIDPVYERALRDAACVRELGLGLRYTLDTHVHADHVTGAWALKHHLGAEIAMPGASGAEGADRYLDDGDRIAFGRRWLEVRHTPGHTEGCSTYVLDDHTMAFTGDCLLIRGCGRTDFQGGSARALFRSVHERIFSLPDNCLLYPGHDYRGLTATSVAEEKRFNPRLGGDLNRDDFAGYMANLGLAHPKKIAEAVPANLRCGRPDHEPPAAPDWAPLSYTFSGVWEVPREWVLEHQADLQIIDVREPAEFTGPLGHIPGASNLPLGDLTERLAQIDPDRPVVAVCRAGGRSAQATVLLKRAGLTRVANLPGGMLRWRADRLPVTGGED